MDGDDTYCLWAIWRYYTIGTAADRPGWFLWYCYALALIYRWSIPFQSNHPIAGHTCLAEGNFRRCTVLSSVSRAALPYYTDIIPFTYYCSSINSDVQCTLIFIYKIYIYFNYRLVALENHRRSGKFWSFYDIIIFIPISDILTTHSSKI